MKRYRKQKKKDTEKRMAEKLSVDVLLAEARRLHGGQEEAPGEEKGSTGADVTDEKEAVGVQPEEKGSTDGLPQWPLNSLNPAQNEDKSNLIESIKGFVQSKIREEDGPDELMLKYGDVGLKSAVQPEEENPEAGSFFFGENEPAQTEEPDEEIASIFEKIQRGRELDQKHAESAEFESLAEELGEELPPETEPAEPVEMAEEVHGKEETEKPEAEMQESVVETKPSSQPKEAEDAPVQTDSMEDKPGVCAKEEEPRLEEPPPQPPPAQKPMTEEELKTAASMELADRVLSQEYRTGEISLEEVIANAEKLMQQRIVPFSREEKAEQKKPVDRYEKNFGKPRPARREPAKGARREEGKAKPSALYRSKPEEENVVIKSGRLEEPVKEELASYRANQPQEATRLFEVVRPGEPKTGAPPPSGKAGKKGAPPSKKKKERFRLFGEEPEGSLLDDQKIEEEELIDDYTEPSDAFSVRSEIVSTVRRMLLRTALTAVLALLGVVLAVCQRVQAGMPASAFAEHVYLYPIFNLCLLAAAAGCCYVPMGSGLASLAKLRGNSDSAVAFAVIASAVQAVFAFVSPEPYITGALSLYTPIMVLALFLNSAGKLLMVRRIQQNFKFVSSPDAKEAVKILTDERLSQRMCKPLGVEAPLIAYTRRTGFLSNFLHLSYEPDPSEKLAGRIAPFGALLSVLVGIGVYFVKQDIQQAVAAFSVCSVFAVPLCCVLAVNRPLRRLCRQACREGSMLVGYPGVRQFSDVNVVEVDAGELYPAGSVILHGIKTFSGQRIDESILQAASIVRRVGGPLAPTFDQIIGGRENILPRMDSIDYEDEMGVVAWVGGTRILLGNRRLLEEHGVAPPSADYIKKYLTGERKAIYLASGGDLVAMFVVTYTADEKVRGELARLEDNGVSFLVRTYDANLTAEMISEHFRLAFRSVRILPHQEGRIFDVLKDEPERQTRAYLATKGRAWAIHRLVAACIRFKSIVSFSVILQMVGVIFSLLLVGVLSLMGGLGQLGTVEMLLYAAFWTAAVLIVPSLRKP